MLKLTKITFGRIPAFAGLRAGELSSFELDNPPAALKDFRAILRGQSLFLVSPPGWNNTNQTQPKNRDPKGPVVIFECPRADAFLHWSGDEDGVLEVLKGVKYETMPFGWKPAPVETDKPILAQIPAGQVGDA